MKKYLLLLFTVMVSCNIPEHYFTKRPTCAGEAYALKNIEPIANSNQAIILDKIRTMDFKEYRYFFKSFIESEEHTYMVTSFAKGDHCFLVKILVDKWDKLGGMLKTNGAYYPKELFDLEWTITTVNGKEEVVFVDMHRIID